MGSMPDWYELMLAADRLHCTPWDLLSRPIVWREFALAAIQAENGAKADLEKRHQRKHGGLGFTG